MDLSRNLKLTDKYYGYQIERKVGAVAYKLKLPGGSTIHPVFHVSLLKQSPKGATVSSELQLVNEENEVQVAPLAILERRMITRNGQEVEQVLIHRQNMDSDYATREGWSFTRAQFPNLESQRLAFSVFFFLGGGPY